MTEPPAAAELVCQVSRQDAPQAAAAAASTDAAAAAGGQAQNVAQSSQVVHEEWTAKVEQVRKGPLQLPQWQWQWQEQATPIKYLGTSLLAQPRVFQPPKQQSGLCRQQQQQQQLLQQQRQSSCSSIAVVADNMDCINAGTSGSSSSAGSGWDTGSTYASSADGTNRASADSSNSTSSASNRRQAVTRGEHKREYEVRSSSHIVAFTDGSCHNNGRCTGVGAFAVVFLHAQSYSIASSLPGIGTSIRAELQAAIYACETADIIEPGRTKTLIIYTDSLFVIKAVTSWVWGWVLRGWRKVDGEPTANPDLVMQLYEHALVRDMTFIKVQAHTAGSTNGMQRQTGWQERLLIRSVLPGALRLLPGMSRGGVVRRAYPVAPARLLGQQLHTCAAAPCALQPAVLMLRLCL